jgi:DNA-binding GntR family transcriptional regulator
VLFATQRPAGPVSAAALGLREGDPVHEVRRVRLGDGRPIVLEQSLFPAAMFPGLLQCRLDGSLYELLETRYGQRPHRARESLEPVTAGVREAEALEVAEGAPLMLVERVAYDRTGSPSSSPATCSAVTAPGSSCGPRSWPASSDARYDTFTSCQSPPSRFTPSPLFWPGAVSLT